MCRVNEIEIRCPVCGKIGSPQMICKHFVKEHPEAYELVKMYCIKYKVGWLCKICGKDFLFITSAYVHILKEHLKEPVENNINILPSSVKEKTNEEMKIVRE